METTTQKETKKAGKFLTFFLGSEEYGIEILKVQEIIGVIPITPIPNMPHYIKGVINLRGRIIPIIDLRTKLSMEETKYSDETCFIIVKSRNVLVGIIVDKVSEVTNINDIEDAPDVYGTTNYLIGIGKINDKVKLLLDIDKVLTENDTEIFKNMIKEER